MVNTLDGYPERDYNSLRQRADQLGGYSLNEINDNETFEAPVHPKDISAKIERSTSRVIEEPDSDFQ